MKKGFLLWAALLSAFIGFAQIADPVEWSGESRALGNDRYEIVLTAQVEPGWHIYDQGPYPDGPNATAFTYSVGSGKLIGQTTPARKSVVKDDPVFGMPIGTYAGEISFVQRVEAPAGTTVTAIVEYMACNADNCLPPTDAEFTFTLGKAGTAALAATVPEEGAVSDTSGTVATVSADDGPLVAPGQGRSLWQLIIGAVLWGFAALLTPCVFPMVPMTVSFFLKGQGTKAAGRMRALFYGFSIVALYTVPIAVIILVTYVLGGDAVTADIFNWLATHWLPNVLFFLIFMIFAVSFFGAFDIVLPSRLVNKSDKHADRGGLVGTFFMALTLVLVSFSCTGPIVGTILVESTQGAIWTPIFTMLVFSVAFALPFTFFAFFPSLLKNLPKSGGWLGEVKVVLGFIELALGLKFLSVADQTYHWGILDREVYLALWIVIFTLLGFYFLGKLRFAHDTPAPYLKVKKLFMAIVTFAFVVYLIPGMFGAPLKALSGYLSPLQTLDFNLMQQRSGGAVPAAPQPAVKYADFLSMPNGMTGFFDYAEGMAYAQAEKKPVFLNFTGHGCVNCRQMEATVFTDPQVLALLQRYVIITLYVDDKMVLPENEWVTTSGGKVLKSIGRINAAFQVERFGINAQPYYVLLDDAGKELAQPKGFDTNTQAFIAFLEEGLKRFSE